MDRDDGRPSSVSTAAQPVDRLNAARNGRAYVALRPCSVFCLFFFFLVAGVLGVIKLVITCIIVYRILSRNVYHRSYHIIFVTFAIFYFAIINNIVTHGERLPPLRVNCRVHPAFSYFRRSPRPGACATRTITTLLHIMA